ncbi:putative colanic acid biosynthesis acetyltransferase [Mameliella alba]|uniref:putative colanic acid biosynthesis acetyltransferase n=1 Tax=Mameliella alba TaxID=561184 RepID=UPI000B53467A|nr:putative colanic acid biosynthesis acetyltransferase [Mameliella alba]OWV39218.1 putative colanic acid biosynthesis acetyltransferase [Mameliella alba]
MSDNERCLRRIAPLELASFQRPYIEGNRGRAWQITWYIVNALVFQSSLLGLLPNAAKARLLRVFGASVGKGLICKPRVNIKYPWFLEIGDHVWIGEDVWIDNLCLVRIGNNVCLSQGARLLTGSHDWNMPDFPFFARPLSLGDGVWVTAFRVLRPGVEVPAQMVVLDDLSASDMGGLE